MQAAVGAGGLPPCSVWMGWRWRSPGVVGYDSVKLWPSSPAQELRAAPCLSPRQVLQAAQGYQQQHGG